MILGVRWSFGKKTQYELLSLVRKVFISGLYPYLWSWVLQQLKIAGPHASFVQIVELSVSAAALAGSYLAPLSVQNHKSILVFGVTVVIVWRER